MPDFGTTRAGSRSKMRNDVAEALRYLIASRVLRTLGLLLGAPNLVFMAQTAVFVLYATSDEYGLGLSDAGVGVLLSVGALGWLLGSLVAGHVEAKLGRSRVLAVSVAFGSVALLVPGVTRNAILVAASGLLTGAFSIGPSKRRKPLCLPPTHRPPSSGTSLRDRERHTSMPNAPNVGLLSLSTRPEVCSSIPRTGPVERRVPEA